MTAPSRVAVISDVHANLVALAAVLAEIDENPPDEIWCLGDVVGYGPEPNGSSHLVQERADLCLAGNHDLAVIGTLAVDEFNGDAAAAVRWTQGVLDDSSRAFLEALSPRAERDGVEMFHGSPVDPVWDYVLSEQAAERSFRLTTAPLLLVGHSHVPLALYSADGGIDGGLADADVEIDLSIGRWLLNPGSVGQPRGNDPRAAWLEIDNETARARFRRVPYDVAQTQAEIVANGLPAALAERLAYGV